MWFYNENHRIEAPIKYLFYFLFLFTVNITLSSVTSPSFGKNLPLFLLTVLLVFVLLQSFIPQLNFLYSSSNLISLNRSTGFLINHTDMGLVGLILISMFNSKGMYTNFTIYALALFLALIGGSKAGILLIFFSLLLYLISKISIRAILVISVAVLLVVLNTDLLVSVICDMQSSVCTGFKAFSLILSNTEITHRSVVNRLDDWDGTISAFQANPIFIILGIGEYSSDHLKAFGSIEVGVLAHIANIGLINTLIFYLWMFFLIYKYASSYFLYNVYSMLILGDFIVNTFQNQIIFTLFLVSIILNRKVPFRTISGV